MKKEDHDHDEVEEYSYSCFDSCEKYPDGCKDCDQVMHEGFGFQEGQDKDPAKKK